MANIDLDQDPVWIEICEKFTFPDNVSWADIMEEEERQKSTPSRCQSKPIPSQNKPKPKPKQTPTPAPTQCKTQHLSIPKGNPYDLLVEGDWRKTPVLHVTVQTNTKNAKPSAKATAKPSAKATAKGDGWTFVGSHKKN